MVSGQAPLSYLGFWRNEDYSVFTLKLPFMDRNPHLHWRLEAPPTVGVSSLGTPGPGQEGSCEPLVL